MLNCTDKFLKYSERVGARFAEHNAGSSPSGPVFVDLGFSDERSFSDVMTQSKLLVVQAGQVDWLLLSFLSHQLFYFRPHFNSMHRLPQPLYF